MNRRAFLQNLAGSAVALSISAVDAPAQSVEVPSYLRGYESLYRKDPHSAALEWFKNARFGLFMTYGLYSQLGRGAWAMLREKIPVS